MRSDRPISCCIFIKRLRRRLNYLEHATDVDAHKGRKENKETGNRWYKKLETRGEVQKNSGYHYTKTIEKSQVFVLRPHIFVVRIVYFKILRYLGKFLLFKEKQVEIIHYQDSYTIAITF